MTEPTRRGYGRTAAALFGLVAGAIFGLYALRHELSDAVGS